MAGYGTNNLGAEDYYNRVTNYRAFMDELNAYAIRKLRSERPDYEARTEGKGNGAITDYTNFPGKPYQW